MKILFLIALLTGCAVAPVKELPTPIYQVPLTETEKVEKWLKRFELHIAKQREDGLISSHEYHEMMANCIDLEKMADLVGQEK